MGNISSTAKSGQVFPDAAPDWKPDESTLKCQICDKSFNVIKRRHHCRACGDVICNDCFSKGNNIKCNLKMYGYIDEQFVCQHCLPLLNDNFFWNNLKEIKKFGKYTFNHIQLINPSIYNHIHRGFNQYSHEFTQMAADKYFAILIPYKFEQSVKNTKETIDLDAIQKDFHFYQLWKTKKIENKTIYPNTIQLLYTIRKNKQYVNKMDDFIFLPKDIYCYGLEKDLFILPKMISIDLNKVTKKWLKEVRKRNLKTNPITKHDIFSVINTKMKSIYNIQNDIQQQYESILSIKTAIHSMENAEYHQNIQKYEKSYQQFNNAHNAFLDYKNEENENNVNVDEYIKLMSNQCLMVKNDMELMDNVSNQNEIKCAFCRENFEATFDCHKLTYCHHEYCVTCCNSIVLLWIRFDLYPICIVDGCFAKCKDRMLFDLPQHIQNRLYIMKQTELCNINIFNNNDINEYYQFIWNTLNCLDENLWQSIEPKLMEQSNESNKNLIKILKRVSIIGIEFHEDFNECDCKQKEEDNEYDEFTYWKCRYLFEIGTLIKKKQFRDKFICCCQCTLKYSLQQIQLFMNNFEKHFNNIYQKILISTVCECYQKHNGLKWNLFEAFLLNLFCQLNIDKTIRIRILSKIKTVINNKKIIDVKEEIKNDDNMNINIMTSSHRKTIDLNMVYNKEQCNMDSKQCGVVLKLLNEYKQQQIVEIEKTECIELYDTFIHCLLYHDKNEIYQLLNDKHKCGNNKCKIYERYNNENKYNTKKKIYQSFDIKYDDDDDDKKYDEEDWKHDMNELLILRSRLMDKIHCYYFDISNEHKILAKQNKGFKVYQYGQQYKNEHLEENDKRLLMEFNNLKDEVTNNEFEWSLSEIQWIILVNECKIIHQTMCSKQSFYIVTNKQYDQYFDSLSLMEIVAIKLFTDYPTLREKMLRCFTSKNIHNQRYKYYFHWNKLLKIICNDGFAEKYNDETNLYQIIQNDTIITTPNEHYFGPLSLTSKKISNSKKSDDVMLKINLNNDDGRYFNVLWLTKFPQNEDILCYDQQIQIKNIYDINNNDKDGLMKYLDVLTNISSGHSENIVLDFRSNLYIKHQSYTSENGQINDNEDDNDMLSELSMNKALNKNEWNILKLIWDNFMNKLKNNNNDNNICKYILNMFEYKIINCTELWIDENIYNYIDCINWNDIGCICNIFESLKHLYLCNGYKLNIEFLKSLTKIIENRKNEKLNNYSLETITILSKDDSWCYQSMQKQLLQFVETFEKNIKTNYKHWTISHQQQSFASSRDNKRVYQIYKEV